MNKIIPYSIITCDCCTSTGMIRKCRFKNCNYRMCRTCNYKYYIQGKNKKCPACRRDVYKNNCCYLYSKKVVIKIKQKIMNTILYKFINNFQIKLCIFKYCNNDMLNHYIAIILTISLLFFYLCVCRCIYQIHCTIIFPSFCSEPFFSKYFILLAFFGLFILLIYYLVYLFIRSCSNIYKEHDDF